MEGKFTADFVEYCLGSLHMDSCSKSNNTRRRFPRTPQPTLHLAAAASSSPPPCERQPLARGLQVFVVRYRMSLREVAPGMEKKKKKSPPPLHPTISDLQRAGAESHIMSAFHCGEMR